MPQFLTAIDLTQNELQNVRAQNLATAPTTPLAGQFWYDTGAGKFVVREGAANVSFSLEGHDHDGAYAALGHNHDDRYYTETEVNNLLSGKSDTAHTHDTRYYTEAEVDTLLSGKSDTSHTHDTFTEGEHDARDHSAALASAALSDLGNVATTAPANGNALLYDTATGTWGPGDVSSGSHNHDALYYTETEVNTLLAGKSDTSHTHDDRYYTDSEVNTLLAGKSDTSHGHALTALSDTTVTTVADNEVLAYDTATAKWINQTAAEAGIATSTHNHDAAYVNEADHTKAAHDALNIDAATVGGSSETALLSRANHTGTQALSTITGHDKAAHDALGINASTLDGINSDAFELVSRKGNANGYASLDAGGKVPTTQLPALALTETFVVADIAARDALTVEEGDVAIVTGNSTSYIYDGTAWQTLLSPTDGVQSVTGGTGITSSGGTNPTISITAGGVGTTQLADLGVTNGKLATDAVTQAKMANGSVGTPELIDGSVTEAKAGFTVLKKATGTIGDGTATSFTVTHGLNTRDMTFTVYRAGSPYDIVHCDVEFTSTTQATLRFGSAPTTGQYRWVAVA